MTLRVQTVTAASQRDLERLVQLKIAKGWQCVGNPTCIWYNGQLFPAATGEPSPILLSSMRQQKWQQPMRRG